MTWADFNSTEKWAVIGAITVLAFLVFFKFSETPHRPDAALQQGMSEVPKGPDVVRGSKQGDSLPPPQSNVVGVFNASPRPQHVITRHGDTVDYVPPEFKLYITNNGTPIIQFAGDARTSPYSFMYQPVRDSYLQFKIDFLVGGSVDGADFTRLSPVGMLSVVTLFNNFRGGFLVDKFGAGPGGAYELWDRWSLGARWTVLPINGGKALSTSVMYRL